MQNNGYIWITLAVILALVELWAIKSIIGSKSKADRKMLWSVLVLFVPLVGVIVWGVAGPKAINYIAASRNG